MNDRWKIAIVLICVLLVPILPFIILSGYVEPWAADFVESTWLTEQPLLFAITVVGLLVSDILLPIPSSLVCLFTGSFLGSWLGTLVCWLGMNLSSLIGYILASRFGPKIVVKISSRERIAEAAAWVNHIGPWALAICRAVPVLAEASVLFVGLYKMNPRKFWPPVIAANLGVSIAYCVLGDIARQQEWLALAMAISLALPILAIITWNYLRRRKPKSG